MAVVRAFPAPPNVVQEVLGTLSVLKNGTKTQIEDLGDRRDVPRVWDPAQCDDQVRLDMWTWCENVATWLNHEYGWRPTAQIPACWPDHPHIAHELPVLACLRYAAGKAPDATPLEEWHRLALPGFLDRMATRIGESGCRKEHDDWPAASRYDSFISPASAAARKALLLESDDSTEPSVRQLRPATAP
jgi:hypothetical protein